MQTSINFYIVLKLVQSSHYNVFHFQRTTFSIFLVKNIFSTQYIFQLSPKMECFNNYSHHESLTKLKLIWVRPSYGTQRSFMKFYCFPVLISSSISRTFYYSFWIFFKFWYNTNSCITEVTAVYWLFWIHNWNQRATKRNASFQMT